jgi:hypothetical protein
MYASLTAQVCADCGHRLLRKDGICTKKKLPNEPTDRAWRYQKRGFPQKNEPKQTQTNPPRRVPRLREA